jgi:5-methylcytosine-specific restriction protein A
VTRTALSPCSEPGCPTLTLEDRCERHSMERDRCRPNARRRGYNNRWERTRVAHLQAHPWCHVCGRRATDVHHVDGRGPLGPRGHDPTNLESLCHSCHSRVTGTGDTP